MRLLEHESKRILQTYRIALPAGKLIRPGDSPAVDAPVVLKAQIPIGGRGKAGGILEAGTADEAWRRACWTAASADTSPGASTWKKRLPRSRSSSWE